MTTETENEPIGENTKKLLMRFVSREAIPPGGTVADGARFLTDKTHRRDVFERAKANMEMALQVLRSTSDNPYGDDDEAIAGAILRQIEQRESGEGGA